ncbi:hypothetical protein SAMN05216583_10247 [Selenomonas sp. KH1T6]|nr:hypothetical protein SAMN05216583_10247 [Selenomonas ruminantium]
MGSELMAKADCPEGLVEMRLDCWQVAALDRALGKMPGRGVICASWYRLGIEHREELAVGRPVTFTLPDRLGVPPRGFGGTPDIRAEWLPVFMQALEQDGEARLAGLLLAVYEAIAWGYAAELYFYDELFDLATIMGRQRLLKRQRVMEEMHGLPALPVGQKLEKEA